MLRVLLAGPPPRSTTRIDRTKVYPEEQHKAEHEAENGEPGGEQKGEPISNEALETKHSDNIQSPPLTREVGVSNTDAETKEAEASAEESKMQVPPMQIFYFSSLESTQNGNGNGVGAFERCVESATRLWQWGASSNLATCCRRCFPWVGSVAAALFMLGGVVLAAYAAHTVRVCDSFYIAHFGDASRCAQPQYYFADQACGIYSIVALECHQCVNFPNQKRTNESVAQERQQQRASSEWQTERWKVGGEVGGKRAQSSGRLVGRGIFYIPDEFDSSDAIARRSTHAKSLPWAAGINNVYVHQLSLLRCIDVSGNRQLTKMPQWWGHIPNLRHLNASMSGVKNLPSSLCSGTMGNTLTTIDVKSTPASHTVDWHHNPDGTVPRLTSLSNMSLACRDAVRDTVVRLNISHNRFSTIQAMVDLDEFSQLTSVDLRWNNITHFAVQWAETPIMLLPTTGASSSQKPEILFEKIQEWYAKDVVSNFKTMDGIEDEDEGVDATKFDLPEAQTYLPGYGRGQVFDLPFSSIFQHAVDLSASPSSVLNRGGMKYREKGEVVGGGRGGGDPSMKTFQKIPCPVLGLNGENPMTTFSFLNIPCTYIIQFLYVVMYYITIFRPTRT